MEIIQINEKDYKCFDFIDACYTGFEEINNELEVLRQILEDVDYDIGLKEVHYRLVVYEQDDIDAFVTKYGMEYILGISTGAFAELKSWFKMCFMNDEIYNVLKLEKEKGEYYTRYAYRKAWEFLVLHEYTHMKNGHCDVPENEKKLIYEQSKKLSREEAIFSQTLEFDADNWAVAQCVVKILEENITAEEKNEKLKLLVFAIYTIFKKFSEYDKYTFETFMNEDLLQSSHPAAWIRYRYMMATIFTNILDSSHGDEKILEKDLVNVIMDFERQVLNIKDSTELMFIGAHTKKGTEHLMLLCDSWNKVADKLEKYAYDTLIRVNDLDVNVEEISLIAEDGKIIL